MFKQSDRLKGYRLLLISLSPLFFSACVSGPAPINQTYLPPVQTPAVPPPQNEPYQPAPPQYSPPPTQYSPPQTDDGFAPPPPGYNPNKPQNYSVREENATQQYSGTAAVIDKYEEPETITVAMLPNDMNNTASSYEQAANTYARDEVSNASNNTGSTTATSASSSIAPPSVSPFGAPTSTSTASTRPPPRPVLNKDLLDANHASPPVQALISGAKRDMRAGNAREAFAKLERALRIEPENSWVWHNMAKVNLSRGKYEQAITMAKNSNDYTTDTHLQRQNWRLIGYASEQKGDVRGMQEAYQNEQLIR